MDLRCVQAWTALRSTFHMRSHSTLAAGVRSREGGLPVAVCPLSLPLLWLFCAGLTACAGTAENPADPASVPYQRSRFLELLQLGGGGGGGTTSGGVGPGGLPACSPCYLYVTGSGYGPGGVGFSTAAGADSLCSSDAARPNASSYKAVLVDNVTRRASTGPNDGLGQIDWVLGANIVYRRPSDNFTVMITNAQRIFPFGALTNTIDAIALFYWTGLNVDWTTGTNCSGWASAAGGVFGVRGNSGGVTSTSLNAVSDSACNIAQGLLCAEY